MAFSLFRFACFVVVLLVMLCCVVVVLMSIGCVLLARVCVVDLLMLFRWCSGFVVARVIGLNWCVCVVLYWCAVSLFLLH